MKPNRMKAKLKAGEPALGCSVMFPSPQIVEMLGHAGFDWVLLDCEHGSLSPADVEVMAMAADAVGITAIARPRTNSNADIQSVMDRGVMGVQVPHVNTADDARRAVAAVKFGPGAGRGSPLARAPITGVSAPRWRTSPPRQRAVAGLRAARARGGDRNADEILKVEDIDVFFIGPSDLSQSMGHPGNAERAGGRRGHRARRVRRSSRPAKSPACRRRRTMSRA